MSSPVENVQYDAAFSAVSPSKNTNTLLQINSDHYMA